MRRRTSRSRALNAGEGPSREAAVRFHVRTPSARSARSARSRALPEPSVSATAEAEWSVAIARSRSIAASASPRSSSTHSSSRDAPIRSASTRADSKSGSADSTSPSPATMSASAWRRRKRYQGYGSGCCASHRLASSRASVHRPVRVHASIAASRTSPRQRSQPAASTSSIAAASSRPTWSATSLLPKRASQRANSIRATVRWCGFGSAASRPASFPSSWCQSCCDAAIRYRRLRTCVRENRAGRTPRSLSSTASVAWARACASRPRAK